jgi:diguanylate cyclase (GGDEF)-like protein/PAS domain S-box-containing protein
MNFNQQNGNPYSALAASSNDHDKKVILKNEIHHDRFPHLNPLPKGEEANEGLRVFQVKRMLVSPLIIEDIKAMQTLVDALPAAVFVKDAKSRFQLMNKACEDQWGMKFSDLQGTDASQFFPSDQMERFLAKDREVFAGGHQIDYEETFWNANLKQDRLGHTFKKPIYDEFGNPQYLICITSDITERKLHEEALKVREDRFRTLFDRASEGILLITSKGEFIACNNSFANMHGYTTQEILSLNTNDLDTPDSSQHAPERMRRIFAGESLTFEVDHYRKDGSVFPMEISASLVNVEGEPLIQSFSRDISERKLAEERLRVLAVAFETHEAIMITDANARIIKVNQAFQDITGYSSEDVLGKNPRILSAGLQDQVFYAAMWAQLLSRGTWAGEIWDKRKSGQVYPKLLTITAVKDKFGKTTEYVAIFKDITELKRAEDEIHNLAFYDGLTKLPNRRLLMDRLRAALTSSARSNHYGAVLFLDMDKFKTLNDTLGHEYGDLLLIEVAKRIQSCVREVDTVARLGGDEFVILLEDVDEFVKEASQKAAVIADKIRISLSLPYMLNNKEQHSSPSIGVTLYNGNTESAETLIKKSDMAMYQAKDSGRNAVRFFNPVMQQAVETRASIEADLRHAVHNQELRLYYQIQLDGNLKPFGAEALVRWEHPKRGLVFPAQFIPISEESSLILEIGCWVLEAACRQLGMWAKSEQTRDLILAVNVSAKQFNQYDFVEKVSTALDAHEVKASSLKLELTESVVLNDVTTVVSKMLALQAIGVKLSIDDFGTGYSSLSYLKQLPIDQIKIDQSFVRDIATDPNDAIMVRTIIDLARNFRLNVIAEGVETEAQLAFLKQHGCMAYQGYLFGKPVLIDEFEALLNKI